MPRAKVRVQNDLDRRRRLLAEAVMDYVSIVFNGNMTEAARQLGVAYDPLRNMALGIARRPNLTVLSALAKHSGVSIEEWLAKGHP